jgi:hypothetical protein
MTHWTLDILLTNDPSSGVDKTGEWEKQCDNRNSPKMKFPLKLTADDSVLNVETDFIDPKVDEPRIKTKKDKEKDQVRVVTLQKKRTKDKNKLF